MARSTATTNTNPVAYKNIYMLLSRFIAVVQLYLTGGQRPLRKTLVCWMLTQRLPCSLSYRFYCVFMPN